MFADSSWLIPFDAKRLYQALPAHEFGREISPGKKCFEPLPEENADRNFRVQLYLYAKTIRLRRSLVKVR